MTLTSLTGALAVSMICDCVFDGKSVVRVELSVGLGCCVGEACGLCDGRNSGGLSESCAKTKTQGSAAQRSGHLDSTTDNDTPALYVINPVSMHDISTSLSS